MLGTPGNPIVTEEWQFALVLVVGVAIVALIHRIVRRRVARDRRDRND
ncbi:MAG: hypothetical protein ABTQ29_03885 [Siculibacillus sp.]